VEARRGLLRLGPGQELALGRLALSGALDVDDELLELDRAEAALEDVTVNISGRVEQLCEPMLALDAQVFLPLRTLTQAGLLPKTAQGHLWSRLSVNGPPAAPHVSLELAGSNLAYGKYGPGSLTARLAYAGDKVTVEELTVPVGSGDVRVTGTVGLDLKKLPVQLVVETRDASFGHILEKAGLKGSWVDFPATARAHLGGTVLPRPNLSGDLDLRNGRFVLASRAFDAPPDTGRTLLTFERGRLRSRVALLGDRVELTSMEVESGGSHLQGEVTLFYDPRKGLLVNAHGDMDLSDFGHIAELKWAGHGSVSTTVEGPYSDVKIGASLSLRDFEFWDFSLGVVQAKASYQDKVLNFPTLTGQKGRTQYFGNAALTFGRSIHTRAEVEVPRGRTEDLIDLIAGLSSTISVMQGPLVGDVSGRVEIDSPMDQFEGLVALEFKNTLYYGRHMGDGSSRLRFEDGKAMVLERSVLEGRLGRTWVDGSFFFSGPDKGKLDYRFGGENLSLAELVGPESERLGVKGTLAMEGKVEGNTDLPITTGRLWGPQVTFANRNLGGMSLEARLEGRELMVAGRPSRDTSGILRLNVREPYKVDAAVTLELPEIRPLLPVNDFTQELSGSVKAVVMAQGALLNPQTIQMTATVERLTLSHGQFTGATDGPIALSYANGRLDVPSFIFRGPDTELSASGWVGQERLELFLRGAMDLRLLESVSPMLVRTGGRVELTAVAGGSPRAPTLAGNALIEDARMSVRDQPLTLRDVDGRVEFTQERILLESLQGLLNEGRVQASGDVRLDKFEPSEVTVNVSLTDVATRFHEDIPFSTTGQLWLTGNPDALRLGGALDIRNLRYRRGLELDDILKRLARRSVLPTLAEKPREYLTFDVGMHLGDVRVDNNLARTRLLGSLRLTGTNARLGVLGTVETEEGSQAYFRNNQFTINRGQIEFQDRYGIDPVFDLYAQAQVREYQVKLHAYGRPAAPQVDLTSEPGLSEGDVISLLTLGLTSTDKETAASASAGLAAEAFFNISGLDKQVKRFLPNNPVLKDLSLQISTTYNDATQQAEPTARLESKFLTEQLKIGLTQPVSGRGTRARAEYHFDNRLSARAQWDNENSENALGNLGLELKLSWESQ
jgi:translocation and assembly module TamB